MKEITIHQAYLMACMRSAAGLAFAAHDTADDAVKIRDQIRMLEGSVTQSSAAHLYSAEQRAAKLELWGRARVQVGQGDYGRALDLVAQVGRMPYPMQTTGEDEIDADRRRDRLEEVDQALQVLLPPAYGIAEEKAADTAILDRVVRQHEQALMAWKTGNLERAEERIGTAYDQLQTEVARPRLGGMPAIDLPSTDNREACEEAERRYQDWLFTAEWMEQAAASMEACPATIAAGTRLAEEINAQARAHAARRAWAAAVAALDQAYAVMEEHWRTAGIDT